MSAIHNYYPPYSPTSPTSTFVDDSEQSYGRRTSDTSISVTSTFTAASTITSQPYLPIAEKFYSPTSNAFISSPTHSEYPIEHVDVEAIWYRKYFIQKQHPTFIGITESYGTVIVSLMLDGTTINNNRDNIYWYRYILRKKESPDDRGVLAGPPPPSPLNDPPWDVLLRMISRELVQPRLKKLITTPELSEKLLALDEDRLQTTYKVGVLYCAPSQTTEEEWFSNTLTSDAFSDFLELLGTKVKLSEFGGFSGGLDTKTNETGDYSVYDDETIKNYEIMYHVSTMLPYETSNKYQITRKRHIGNDIVCIIFQDVAKPFSPSSIRSQFLHVYVIVSPVVFELDDEFGGRTSTQIGYRVEVVCKDGVPYFGPPLPDPPIFQDSTSLRKFLVATIINGQNAAWKTPKLSEPFQRARGGIIQDIANKLVPFSNEVAPPPPQPPKKLSHVELNYILKRLFVDRLKFGGVPPDMTNVKELLEKGANPNIRIPQPRPLREKGGCQHCTFCPNHNSKPISSSPSINHKLHKLPNILFATIALADDPDYIKFLINYGVETMPKDSHFPNAFVFAATHKRVETMKCLLENVPALSDPESVDSAINDTYNSAYSRNTNKNGNKLCAAYGNKLWNGISFAFKIKS